MRKSDRGVLTEKISEKHNITQEELRLMPYIQYCCINNLPVNPRRISPNERMILKEWIKKGLMVGNSSEEVAVTRKFWDKINDCLWYAYANKMLEENE